MDKGNTPFDRDLFTLVCHPSSWYEPTLLSHSKNENIQNPMVISGVEGVGLEGNFEVALMDRQSPDK